MKREEERGRKRKRQREKDVLDSILGSKNARGHTYDARIRPQSFDPFTNETGREMINSYFIFLWSVFLYSNIVISKILVRVAFIVPVNLLSKLLKKFS